MITENKERHSQPDALKVYFKEIKKHPLLTAEEERELARRIRNGDDEALNKMIESNLRLVVKIAKGYRKGGIPLLDLIQEGNVGLIKAAGKFDYRKKSRFSTYAACWIKQSITRALSKKYRNIRLPIRKEEALRMIDKVSAQLSQQLGREPLVREIAAETGMNETDIENILADSREVVSLHSTRNREKGTILEILKDYTFDPNKELIDKSLKEDTHKVLEQLKEQEKHVLRYRYAFHDGKRYTLKSIGEELGFSAEKVRQIEMRALRKLREPALELREYCFDYSHSH